MQPRSTAVISGSADRVAGLRPALEAAGFAVIAVGGIDQVASACAGLDRGSVACYIQAPLQVPAGSGTAAERLAGFLAGGLVARGHLAAKLWPLLRPDATVVLVAGHRPDDDLPDDPHARFDLLRVLAAALRAEHPAGRVLIAGPHCSPAEIAAVATGSDPRASALVAAVTATEAEADAPLNYAYWRTDLLSRLEPVDWHHSISPAEDTTRYVGWVKYNGERAVIAARGAVVSPLAAEPAPSWSTPSLAQAVLHDALRPHPAREVCHDPGCPECRQADQAAATLAGPFAAEVLSHLPEQEFTLSGHAVRSWAQRRLPSRGTGRALNR